MKSWAITRGPSLDPNEKRLAVHVEDHPIEYNAFEGTIPQGEYGGGTVMIWDRGRWLPEGDPHKGYAKGHLVFDLDGEKLHGRWHLVRMRTRDSDRHDNWLLIKGKDEEARGPRDKDIIEERSRSVVSGRSIEEIAAGKGEENGSGTATAAPARTRWKTSRNPRQRTRRAAPKGRCEAEAESESRCSRGCAHRWQTGGAEKRRRKARGSARLCSAEPRRALGKAAERPGGLHEIKFDGYRMEARLDHGKVRLLTRSSRTGRTVSNPLPMRSPRFRRRRCCSTAKSSWRTSAASAVSRCCRPTSRMVAPIASPITSSTPASRRAGFFRGAVVERKAALARLLQAETECRVVRYTDHFNERGALILDKACEMGLRDRHADGDRAEGRGQREAERQEHHGPRLSASPRKAT